MEMEYYFSDRTMFNSYNFSMSTQDNQVNQFSICDICQDNQLKKSPDLETRKTRLYVKQACTNCRAKKEKCSGGKK
ncbi:8171_t:CDS:1, partial [Racocetra persica]